MQNNSKLIGAIDPGAELLVTISQRHRSDLETLTGDYGWVGEGLKPAFGNSYIVGILDNHRVDTVILGPQGINFKDAFGNNVTLPEPEQRVLEDILLPQYSRSVGLVDVVRKGEFERYANVGRGAFKGLGAGIAIASIMDLFGLRGAVPETFSRLIPGILESSSLSNQVQKERNESTNTGLASKIKSYVLELASDARHLPKRVPRNLYNAINLFGLVDRVRGKEGSNYHSASQTDLWSVAQESAPYRGAAFMLALGYSPFRHAYNFLYGVADSLAVFWINSGNNVQGSAAVYSSVYKNLSGKTSSAARNAQKAFGELWSDPFQRANIIGCAVWLGGVELLRLNGIMLEEYFGRIGMSNLGAAAEAAAIGVDTVAIALGARWMEHRRVVDLPKWELNPGNLLYLAHKYHSQELMDSLSDSRNPVTFTTYHVGNAGINSYHLTGTIKDKAVLGVYWAKEAIGAAINHVVNFISKTIP